MHLQCSACRWNQIPCIVEWQHHERLWLNQHNRMSQQMWSSHLLLLSHSNAQWTDSVTATHNNMHVNHMMCTVHTQTSFHQWRLVKVYITRSVLQPGAPIFEKSFDELMWKSDLRKTIRWACDYQKILQKSYEKLRKKLCKTYEKLTTTLQVSHENVKFAESDVID